MDDVIEIPDDMDWEIKSTTPASKYKSRKIVFCVDVSEEMETVMKASMNGSNKNPNLHASTRLETVQRFLKRYVAMNILVGNEADEYAIIVLTDVATWSVDFTSNISIFNIEIDTIASSPLISYKDFDTQSLVDTIDAHANAVDTDYYYHVILIYGRSTVMPRAMIDNTWTTIRKRSNFMFDLLFLHDAGAGGEDIQNIYDFWEILDEKSRPGWYYESNLFSGIENIAVALSQLVGHPACRTKQSFIKQLL